MAARLSRKRLPRYSLDFKLKTVKLTQIPGMEVQAVARQRLIFHRDRGIEYAAPSYRDRLRALGVRQSMTSGGAPSENPHAESFFHSLKADVIHGVEFLSDESLRACLRWYVPFHNQRRLHSSLGYRSPDEFEKKTA